jgi:hypothetical protein
MLVLNKADLIIISLKINLFSPGKFAELVLKNNHSLRTLFSRNHKSTEVLQQNFL